MSVVGAIRRWLLAARGRDDSEQREAGLLPRILLVLIAVVAIVALGMIVLPVGNPRRGLLALALLEPLFLIPFWLLRTGHFPIAATATVAVFEFLVVAATLAPGAATPG